MVRKSITCISLLFIGCGISYFGIDYYNCLADTNNNNILVSKYFERKQPEEQKSSKASSQNEYVAILEIPKIKFKRGLYAIDNPLSNLNKNIIFLDSSDMPSDDNSRVIIAGHNGNTSNAFFHNLYKLRIKDKIILYYKNIKYTYQVMDIYDIIKCGSLAVESHKSGKTLTLITCKESNKQLVIVSTLIKEEVC